MGAVFPARTTATVVLRSPWPLLPCAVFAASPAVLVINVAYIAVTAFLSLCCLFGADGVALLRWRLAARAFHGCMAVWDASFSVARSVLNASRAAVARCPFLRRQQP